MTEQLYFHALEKEMATHSSVLAWRIPGTGEPGGLPSMGSHRVGHNWSDLAAVAAARHEIGIWGWFLQVQEWVGFLYKVEYKNGKQLKVLWNLGYRGVYVISRFSEWGVEFLHTLYGPEIQWTNGGPRADSVFVCLIEGRLRNSGLKCTSPTGKGNKEFADSLFPEGSVVYFEHSSLFCNGGTMMIEDTI